MNKKVCIKISGLHGVEAMGDGECIEVINIGSYYKRNGKHYVRYEELSENGDTLAGNLIKITQNEVEIIARGTGDRGTHMVFTNGQKNMSYYSTPYGGMNMGVETYDLNVSEEKDVIRVDIHYGLEINLDYVTDCRVHIIIESVNETIE
ncbi:MAG: DUF1934 domain-containing protein [Butyrivibrio sp.]